MSLYTVVADLEIVTYSKILKLFWKEKKKKEVQSVAQSALNEIENVFGSSAVLWCMCFLKSH